MISYLIPKAELEKFLPLLQLYNQLFVQDEQWESLLQSNVQEKFSQHLPEFKISAWSFHNDN